MELFIIHFFPHKLFVWDVFLVNQLELLTRVNIINSLHLIIKHLVSLKVTREARESSEIEKVLGDSKQNR